MQSNCGTGRHFSGEFSLYFRTVLIHKWEPSYRAMSAHPRAIFHCPGCCVVAGFCPTNRSFCPMDSCRNRSFVRWTVNARRILSDVRMPSAFCVSDADVRVCAPGALFAVISRCGTIGILSYGTWQRPEDPRARTCAAQPYERGHQSVALRVSSSRRV